MAKTEPEQPAEATMEEIRLIEQLADITPDTVFKPNYWAKEDIIGDIHLWAMTETIISGATDKIRKGIIYGTFKYTGSRRGCAFCKRRACGEREAMRGSWYRQRSA